MKRSFGLSLLVLMLVLNPVAFSSAEDTTAPTVISTAPASFENKVDVNSSVTARFSEAMDSSTITTSTFTLRSIWGLPVHGVVTYFLGRAKFDPNTDLAYSTTYTATITTGVKDLAGNAMAANKVWSFTTAPPPDTTAPTVISTAPADNATNVALNASITATFSEMMDSSTITTSSFILKDSGNNSVSGAVTYSGTTATFTPSSRLISETVYTAIITTAAKDLAGNPLAADKTWSFTTANRTWTHPADLTDNISPDGYALGYPQAAMDNNGNAVIVWHQSDGPYFQIFKSEYRNGAWTHPADLADNISPDGKDAINPHVAMDDNGNAVIVWQQSDGTYSQIFKSEYRNGAWTHPADLADNISPDGKDVINPHVAMDDNGNAVIVWQQSNHIFKSEYRNGLWTHPASPADNINYLGLNALNPQVAMSDNDNAVIVWQQSDGPYSQIFKSDYRYGAWTSPFLNDNVNLDGQDAINPNVAMDNNGNAVIVWQQSDGINWQIFKSEHRNGIWMPPFLNGNISPYGRDAINPRVAMDDNGNAVIVWQQSDGINWQIFKSEHRNGLWTHPFSLTDNISTDGQNAFTPQTAMDNKGTSIIVWHGGFPSQVYKSEYRNGAWTHPADLADNISPDGTNAGSPRVVMDKRGDAVIVWQQHDGMYNQIFKSEFR